MLTLLTQINWFAVIVAGMAALLIGIVWYLPLTSGARWAGFVKRYTGLSNADLMPSNILLTMGLWLPGLLGNAIALAILMGAWVSVLGCGNSRCDRFGLGWVSQ